MFEVIKILEKKSSVSSLEIYINNKVIDLIISICGVNCFLSSLQKEQKYDKVKSKLFSSA